MEKSNIALTVSAALAMSLAAWPQTPTPSATAEILRQARVYQVPIPRRPIRVVPKYVAVLEEATKADPENADLWDAMGVAYLAQSAGVILTGGKPADAAIGVQKGPQALERALKLNPDHPGALASHGGMQAMMASFMRRRNWRQKAWPK